jgi:hypothetical protein
MFKRLFLLILLNASLIQAQFDIFNPSSIPLSILDNSLHTINAMTQEFMGFGEEEVNIIDSTFDRSAAMEGNEENWRVNSNAATMNCPSALLLSCETPLKYIPALAYDNYDGTWTYCTESCCLRM